MLFRLTDYKAASVSLAAEVLVVYLFVLSNYQTPRHLVSKKKTENMHMDF
jgi:hypothetical protein